MCVVVCIRIQEVFLACGKKMSFGNARTMQFYCSFPDVSTVFSWIRSLAIIFSHPPTLSNEESLNLQNKYMYLLSVSWKVEFSILTASSWSEIPPLHRFGISSSNLVGSVIRVPVFVCVMEVHV